MLRGFGRTGIVGEPSSRRPRGLSASTLVRAALAPCLLLAGCWLAAAAQAAGTAYVTNQGEDAVGQFAIGAGESLSPLSPATIASGVGPQGVAVTPSGTSVYVTNSGESTVSQYNVNPKTGALSAKTPATVATGEGPLHPGVAVSPDGKSAYVTNSNEDTVSQYDTNPTTGALSPKTPATIATGAQPVGIALTPDGKSAYVANFEDKTVSQYDVNPTTGALSNKTPATVAAGFGAAGVAVSPDGNSTYVSNAGTISQYDINPTTGGLSDKTPATVAGGPASGSDDTTPIVVSPDGNSVYESSGSAAEPAILQYDVEAGTGNLSPKTPASVTTSGQPSNIAMTPDGNSAYVTETFNEQIAQYNVDPFTGKLSTKTQATVAAGMHPLGIAVGPFPLAKTSTSVECEPQPVVAGQSTTCTATVTTESGASAPTGTVSFESSGKGSFSGEGECELSSPSGASSSCSVTYTPTSTPEQPERSDTIAATYGGDKTHESSKGTATVTAISPTALAQGSFVIGDQSATVGAVVTFYEVEVWGSEWWRLNSLSGGRAPAAFKGFAESSPSPPTCGETWTSRSGNASAPPATVPEYMEVIVASRITQSGSTIAGNAPEVAVVKTHPGYAPSPGHRGTGKVIAVVCRS
jgi:6-phosphogluconolactonase (cycloisomerase 2 family)